MHAIASAHYYTPTSRCLGPLKFSFFLKQALCSVLHFKDRLKETQLEKIYNTGLGELICKLLACAAFGIKFRHARIVRDAIFFAVHYLLNKGIVGEDTELVNLYQISLVRREL